uniref:Uncharacterized protein n=2 Tax=Lotharella globosa TaxID=91324 RepID=A0A7S4E0R6_9EUKA|mmetsp:Transcript_4623/g.9009  ORF Transcript_4623/g.9009 Transcript_4623/m.9009 type:complete len:1005 (+) Transcript_4623:37-3051(+)
MLSLASGTDEGGENGRHHADMESSEINSGGEISGVPNLTMGIGVGNVITDEEVSLRIQAEIDKMMKLTDEEIGFQRETVHFEDSDEELLDLLKEPENPTPKFQLEGEIKRVWNNYLEHIDKGEEHIKESQKQLVEVKETSKKAEEEIKMAKKAVEESKRRREKKIAEAQEADPGDDDDEEPKLNLEPVNPKISVAVSQDGQKKETKAKPEPSEELNPLKDEPVVRRTAATPTLAESSVPVHSAEPDNSSAPQRTIDIWMAKKEDEQRKLEAKRKRRREKERAERQRLMEAEIKRLREQAEREAVQLEREARRRAKKRARARKQRELRKRQLEEVKQKRAKLELEAKKKRRGADTRARMRMEDILSQNMRKAKRQRMKILRDSHIRKMKAEDDVARELMLIAKKLRQREQAIRETRRMSEEDRRSRDFSIEETRLLKRLRARHWGQRMMEEDERSLTVMTIERIAHAQREMERKKQLKLLKERQEMMRREKQRNRMNEEDQLGWTMMHEKKAEAKKRAQRERDLMTTEDGRSKEAMKAERALGEVRRMMLEDARCRQIMVEIGKKRKLRVFQHRQEMESHDQYCKEWNRTRNRRRDNQRKRMSREDKAARRYKTLRAQFEISRMAAADARSMAHRSHIVELGKRRQAASILIQSVFRGYQVRNTPLGREIRVRTADLRRKRNQAALRIQAMWRGYRVRKRIDELRRRLEAGEVDDDDFDYGGVSDDFIPKMAPIPDFSDVFKNADIHLPDGLQHPPEKLNDSGRIRGDEVKLPRLSAKKEKSRSPSAPVKLPPLSQKGGEAKKAEGARENPKKMSARSKRSEYQRKLEQVMQDWNLTDIKAAEAVLKSQKRKKKLTDKRKPRSKYSSQRSKVVTHHTPTRLSQSTSQTNGQRVIRNRRSNSTLTHGQRRTGAPGSAPRSAPTSGGVVASSDAKRSVGRLESLGGSTSSLVGVAREEVAKRELNVMSSTSDMGVSGAKVRRSVGRHHRLKKMLAARPAAVNNFFES